MVLREGEGMGMGFVLRGEGWRARILLLLIGLYEERRS